MTDTLVRAPQRRAVRYRRLPPPPYRWVAAAIAVWIASAVALFGSYVVVLWPVERTPLATGAHLLFALGAVPFAWRVSHGRAVRGALVYLVVTAIFLLPFSGLAASS